MEKNYALWSELIAREFAQAGSIPADQLQEILPAILAALNSGDLRVAHKVDGQWQVQQWLKQAILLCFRHYPAQLLADQFSNFYDKIPLKYADYSAAQFAADKVRVVPPSSVRYGSFVAPNSVLMPCFINIGAYVDSGCMIDTWATVGSCAQIGRNVHLSGGAGIGGVLEPIQANPTIIEDDCFIGARSEIVEGVIVGQGSVISMGVFLGKSTKIYNRQTGEISYGYVPPGSVVVSGNLPAADGSHSLYAAIIIKTVDAQTRAKTSLNQLLRD